MDINQFLGGLDNDSHPSQQKEQTIRYSLNFTPVSEDGNLYSISNESGTTLMNNITFPPGFKPIGHTILNNEIIVILCNASGKSQVGYIVENSTPHPTYGFYHPVGPVDATTGDPLENNGELGFKQIHPVDCVSRKLINGHRLLYFTDNQVPYGYFDLDNPPVQGTVAESVKLTFDQKIPNINVIEIKEGVASSIRAGVVQFITRYITATGGTTVFGIPSEVFPMVPSFKTDGPDSYHGEFYGDGTIAKNLVVQFDNVDTKYQELEVVALFYESEASIFKACIVGQIPIPQTGVTASLQFTYTGPDTDSLIKLTREELQQVIVSYTHAKCIEQKDNHLFLSNLRDERTKSAGNLQKIANAVKVSYRVEDIQYSGRGTNPGEAGDPLFFDKANNPYKISEYDVELQMNQPADASTVVPANFQLKKDGTPSDGKITVANNGSITAGDTITITMAGGYTPGQVNFSLTSIASGTPSNNEYLIGATATETAQNIWQALVDSTSVTDFTPSFFPGNDYVDLIWSTIDTTVNGSTISIVETTAGAITSVNFANANTTPSVTVATTATVSGDIITINFGTTVVSIGDELLAGTPTSLIAVDSSAGSFTTGNVNGLPIVAEASVIDSDAASEPGFTDYTNEFLTATKKGYRRGEVYSLGFKILYKDGSMSAAYHIPGEKDYVINTTDNKFPPTAPNAWPAINEGSGASVGIGKVGTYVSEDTYPLDQGYPGDGTGDDNDEQGPTGYVRNVRHHYMPKLVNEPHFTNSSSSNVDDIGSEKIRVLGLEFEFTEPIPNDILEQADEIIFLRERRNTSNNKSIFAQGLLHRHMVTADNFNNDGIVEGNLISGNSKSGMTSGVLSGYHITEMPWFQLNFSKTTNYGFERNGARSSWGMVIPQNDVNMLYSDSNSDLPASGTYVNGQKFKSETIDDQVMFYSPESVLLTGFTLNPDELKNYLLTEELRIVGQIQQVAFKGDWQRSKTPLFNTNTHRIDKYTYGDYFCQYTKVTSINGTPSNTPLTIEDARYLSPNVQRNESLDPNNPALKTNTAWIAGGLQLYLNNPAIPYSDQIFGSPDPQSIHIRDYYDPSTTKNDVEEEVTKAFYLEPNSGTPGFPDRIEFSQFIKNVRKLYNIQINNTKQYGQINNASYIPIGRFPCKNTSGTFVNSYSNVFGGDTFITKFSFNAGAMVNYRPFYDTGRNPINSYTGSNSQRTGGYANVTGVHNETNTKVNGWDFRTCTYYFVESNINTHYRHRPSDEPKQDYYPNQINKARLLNEWYPYLENIRAYNTQYSYENNVIESYLGGSTNVTVSDFENRTIYSEKAAEDDTLDSYRSFLVSDYYDLPSEKGPIWDTFVEFNTLFMHTPKALWQTFAEGQATIKGANISDAILGTSSLFARPAQEVLETDGGYGGCISQFGGAHTQLGYIFVDVLQGKIFLVGITKTGGTILKEISKEGISTDMHKQLSLGITKINGQVDLTNVTTLNSHLIDNPYMGIGIVSGYDYKLNRYLVTKFSATVNQVKQTDGFTLSYAKDIGKWFSYHSYKPNIYIPYNNRLFLTKGEEFHEMNTGPKGKYFGTTYDSELTFVVTTKGQTCSFNNIVINSISKDRITNVKQKDDNFYEFSVYNDKSNTGSYKMLPSNTFGITLAAGELTVKHRNNEYRVAIPRDSVIDNSADIFNITNLNNTIKFRERIKGNYIIVNLKYDNTNNFEFVLNFIKTIFTNNFR